MANEFKMLAPRQCVLYRSLVSKNICEFESDCSILNMMPFNVILCLLLVCVIINLYK
jgi:hypothetical protein